MMDIRLADDVPSARWLRRNAEVLAAGFVVIELHNDVFRGSPDQRAADSLKR